MCLQKGTEEIAREIVNLLAQYECPYLGAEDVWVMVNEILKEQLIRPCQ